MNDFVAARSQMALSLGFHIIYSCIGMVMPVFMAISHYKYIKTQNPVYKNITQAWSKGVAIFFATGAVSGTMLSFELGLLWPTFMKHAGPIFGMPFSPNEKTALTQGGFRAGIPVAIAAALPPAARAAGT